MRQTLIFSGVLDLVAGISISRASTRRSRVESSNTTSASTKRVSQYELYENHPLAPLSGMFAEDPLWPEYLQAIKQIRQEDDALDNKCESGVEN